MTAVDVKVDREFASLCPAPTAFVGGFGMASLSIPNEQRADTTESVLFQTPSCALDTPESRHASNARRSKSKSGNSKKPSRKSKSLPTSALVSTSSEKDLLPYWNEQCQVLQSMLWCPTTIDCRALDLNSSAPSLSVQVDRSRHLINRVSAPTSLAPTCLSGLSPVFATPTTDGARPKSKEVSRKIRLFPTDLPRWFELLTASRRAYNLCIAAFKTWVKGEPHETDNQVAFRVKVREAVRAEFPIAPSVLLDEAVNSAYLTRQAVIRRRSQGEKCDYSFRKRKDTKQSFVVQRLASGGPFPTILKEHLTEAIPKEAIGKMASVVWECGRWFLICKVIVPIEAESQGRLMVACDPGVRTFLTTFSPFDCAKIGKGFASKIRPMLLRLDKLYGQRKRFFNAAPKEWKQCHRDRFRYFQKRINSIRNKVHDLTLDLHRRAADFLTENYDVIRIPTFETSEMTSKEKRNITSRVVRSMLSLGHYQFRQYLGWIAFKRGKTVLVGSEAYTSKTDSRNGKIVELGPAKTINGLCRDVNGARGNFLRALAT